MTIKKKPLDDETVAFVAAFPASVLARTRRKDDGFYVAVVDCGQRAYVSDADMPEYGATEEQAAARVKAHLIDDLTCGGTPGKRHFQPHWDQYDILCRLGRHWEAKHIEMLKMEAQTIGLQGYYRKPGSAERLWQAIRRAARQPEDGECRGLRFDALTGHFELPRGGVVIHDRTLASRVEQFFVMRKALLNGEEVNTQAHTPLQFLPQFAKTAIERLVADSSLRNPAMLNELLDGYARTYGATVDEHIRESAHQICGARFCDYQPLDGQFDAPSPRM